MNSRPALTFEVASSNTGSSRIPGHVSRLSWMTDKPLDAFVGIRDVVADVLDDVSKTGEIPPQAIADRTYSGKFMVRGAARTAPTARHRGGEQNVSLNRLAAIRLAGA